MNPMQVSASTMYATDTVNVRSKPSTKSKVLHKYYFNEKVEIIRILDKKWTEVAYKGKTCFVATKYLSINKKKYIKYSVPSNDGFKSFEDMDCLTDNAKIPQGKLKQKYHVDKNGLCKVGNRYCIALGSYYSTEIGTKIDLVLKHKNKKRIVKCILTDCKNDKHTNSTGQYHMVDGSVAEFVVDMNSLSDKALNMGDVSYANKKLRGTVVEIRVYKKGK